MGLTLVLGATRSGKSAYAERLARDSGLPVRYVATADPQDGSMATRIAAHVLRRPPEWETVVAGDDLAAAMGDGRCLLVDGLGTWIAGVIHRAAAETDDPPRESAYDPIRARVDAFVRAAARTTDPVIVVAEQAGAGLLPPDPLSRRWLDALGEATQTLSEAATRVVLVVAGRPLELPIATTEAGEDLRYHGDTLVAPGDVDHAVNVLAGGPPAWLREALRRALEEDVDAYPREAETVAAIAALHGRAPEEIVPCNGAAQALWLLPAALRPRLAACVHPGFTETEAALRAHGVPIARVLCDPEEGFALRPEAVPDAADLVTVGNPASPSGTLLPTATLLALRRPGRTIVVDEAFMDMVPGEPASLVRDPLPDLIVVRSLTKSLAIPGLRAGYAVAPPALADRLRAVRPPWSCNVLALAALRAIAERPEALAAGAVRAQEERADLEARLAGIAGLRTWPAAANYVLVRVRDGAAVAARLREAGIAVRPAASFPGLTADDLRITARGPQANERLAGVLAEAVGAVITVVGIGADGWSSLSDEARELVLAADLLVGGERQLELVPAGAPGERRAWPKPMTTLIDELRALAGGRAVVVLASGDPLLHGVGATILRRLGDEGVRILPNISSFALACARLRWPQGDTELVSATSRIPEVLAPALQPGRRLVVLGFGPRTAAEIARVARERGYGASRLVVLEQLGAAAERIEESTADAWGDRDAVALHLVALEVRGDGPLRARVPGLPDDAYEHDGQITKRDVRAVTLAALVPVPGQLLWDVGAGSGSVAIEWLRAAPGAHAIAIERDEARAQRIARNALTLGVPWLRVVQRSAPDAFDELGGRPDAIFIGGGLTGADLLTRSLGLLAPGGRLVANVVTVEGETILARAHAEHGGRLTRLAITHAEPLGGLTGWRPAMAITQWELRVP